MELSKHPIKPRLTLRVGITGHREIDPTKVERIRADLDSIFSVLDRTVDGLGKEYAAYFDTRQPLKRLISPLAEGADMLTADVASSHGYEIQSPLPFPIEEYARDFQNGKEVELNARLSSVDAIFELDGHREGDRMEETSYLAAGYLTLRQCDLLVAVWNGQAARGLGGTAMIVEAAIQRGVPVIWVDSVEPTAPALVRPDLLRGPPIEEIREFLWQTLAPPFAAGPVETADPFSSKIKRTAEDFFAEKERRWNFGLPYQLFFSLIIFSKPRNLRLRVKPYLESTKNNWASFSKVIADQRPEILRRLDNILLPRFAWADGLANYYAAIYRSSYVLNYMLGAFSIFLALAGLILDLDKTISAVLEVVALFAIIGITSTGQRKRWHERWIDYRQLAEQLRHLRFLYLTGAATANTADNNNYDGGSTEGSWVQWYHKATLRELGLAPAKASADYVGAVKRVFLQEEVSDQIDYHRGNARRMHAMEHSLHRLGEVMFTAALTVSALYLLFALGSHLDLLQFLSKEQIDHWTIFIGAFLPALGAALSGIRVQGEFSSTAERSEAMVARLEQLQRDLVENDKLGESSLSRLRGFVEVVCETMLIENVDWRSVYRGKPLSLPA